MFTIDQLDVAPSTLTILMRGTPVEIRSVTASEIDAVKRVVRQPRPVMTPNPIIGAEPRFVPDNYSAEYFESMDRWTERIRTAVVAIATGIKGLAAPGGSPRREYVVGMSDEALKAYMEEVVPLMRSRLSVLEIDDAYEAVTQLSDPMTGVDGSNRIEAAKKNLFGLDRARVLPMIEALFPGSIQSRPDTSNSASVNGSESPATSSPA